MQALYSFTQEKIANASPPCRHKKPVTPGVMSALCLLLSGNLAQAAQGLAVEEFAAIREGDRLIKEAPAVPPAAADLATPVPVTVTLDDPRDGIQCPEATPVYDLGSWFRDFARVQSGQTIVLCSGEYQGPLDIHGVANVQVRGKNDYRLGPPRIVPALTMQGPETFRLIQILNSSNVTISGLVLDGIVRNPANGIPGEIAWPLTPFHPISGIYVNNASVTIKNNWIMHMHTPDRDFTGIGIRVEGNSAAAQQIRVQNNSLLDTQEAAIQIGGLHTRYEPIITGNVIATPGHVGIRLMWVQAGTVSGNIIGPDPDVRIVAGENCGRCGTGISLDETRHVNVTANLISSMGDGVLAGSIHQEFPFSDNTISGNTIRDTTDGITLLLTAQSTGQAFVTGNKFTGNTITDSFHLPATRAITVVNAGVPDGVGLSNNTISGNTIVGYGATKAVISSDDTNPAHVAITNNKIVGFKAGVLP